MKKIIGILVALSLVLSLTVMATPVLGNIADVEVDLDEDFDCAGQIGVYNISFETSCSLTEGLHSICIKFPTGTVIQDEGWPVPWANGDIETDMGDVYGTEITVTGTEICFLVPTTFEPGPHWVYFSYDACIINPPAGYYQLEVYADRECDSTPVKNELTYHVVPCFSTYVFEWDSSPTYSEIAKDFVPPFKACGQNDTNIDGFVEHPWVADAWMNAFNLTFGTVSSSLKGCQAPCEAVDIYFQLTESPQVPCGMPAYTVTLNFTVDDDADAEATDLATANYTWEPCKDDDGIPEKYYIAEEYGLDWNTTIEWAGLIHFNLPGDYTICFTAECLGGPACEPPICDEENILVQKCIDFHVYQNKDAAKLTLDEKWNLISLPLVPFDTDLCNMIASVDLLDYYTVIKTNFLVVRSNLVGIWYYDAAAEDWLVYGNGQDSLTTIEDGKAYWFRLRYPLKDDYAGAPFYLPPYYACGNYTWWVFGTQLPEPPDGPKVYSVEEGWNMVGFTSMTDMDANVYLQNWDAETIPVPVIMGWNHGCFPEGQGWYTVGFNATDGLVSGQGYWMAFASAGSIYQNVP